MKTILIVDSSHATLVLLQEEFAEAGYRVLITESGDEAMEILNNPATTVDLVVTNLRHRGLDMLDFIKLIKRSRPGLPVICHTALSKYQELTMTERPFDALVDKSSDLAVLKDSVASLLGRTT